MNLLETIFVSVTGWFEGFPPAAAGAAFLWGMLSVLLSPCHLSSIPLAIGYVNRRGGIAPRSAFSLSLVFALGILLTIALIGAITAGLGRMLGDVGFLKYVVGLVFVLVGLWLIGIFKLPDFGFAQQESLRGGGLRGAFLLGLLFGLALGPCSFGFMMPLLAVVFREAADRPALALLLTAAYAFGHSAVIVAAGLAANLVQRWLDWNERSRGLTVFRIVCGVLVVLAGISQLLAA